MEIDLRRYWLPALAEFDRSLRTFQQKNSKVAVSTVGLFGDGFHGYACLYVDTPAHCTDFVREFARSGSVSQDRAGHFCSNCPDFAYRISEFWFPNYPDLYEQDTREELIFIGLDGSAAVVDPEAGDTGKHCHVFPFLKILIASLQPFSMLSRSSPFRVGVQMMDNQHEFWLQDAGAGNAKP